MRIREEKGFTLIELMVVILIIGILVAIAVPVFNAARDNADLRACQANQRTIIGAAETYMAAMSEYPDTIDDMVTDYLREAPECPAEGTYTFSTASGSPTISCSVTGHTLLP